MYTNKLAKSFSLALAVAVTASVSASFAESEASLQAQSQSSTMNSAQSARETNSSASTQNNSQSSNQQTSQAATHNNSNGNSEAVGGSLGANKPTPPNASVSSPNRGVTNAPPSQLRTTSSLTSVNPSVATKRVPHTVTRSYAWRSPRTKRSFSSSYMTKTVRQASVTH
ncbi:hypothetical protein BH10CYA1_BH10CYA1_15260 [soil metagenome]